MPGANPSLITIAVVHADELVRAGARNLLNPDTGFEVVFAGTRLDEVALGVASKQVPVPQVVLVHWAMPLTAVEEALHRWRKQQPTVPVVVVGELGVRNVQRAVEAGVYGVLPCNVCGQELHLALRTVAQGGIHGNEAMRHQLRRGLRGAGKRAVGEVPALTPRQAEVLHWMCQSKGYTCKEIADKMNCRERTVQTHRTALFKKLNVTKETAAVAEAYRRGLVS